MLNNLRMLKRRADLKLPLVVAVRECYPTSKRDIQAITDLAKRTNKYELDCALHHAVILQKTHVVRTLLDLGADPMHRNHYHTVMEEACRRNAGILKMLLDNSPPSSLKNSRLVQLMAFPGLTDESFWIVDSQIPKDTLASEFTKDDIFTLEYVKSRFSDCLLKALPGETLSLKVFAMRLNRMIKLMGSSWKWSDFDLCFIMFQVQRSVVDLDRQPNPERKQLLVDIMGTIISSSSGYFGTGYYSEIHRPEFEKLCKFVKDCDHLGDFESFYIYGRTPEYDVDSPTGQLIRNLLPLRMESHLVLNACKQLGYASMVNKQRLENLTKGFYPRCYSLYSDRFRQVIITLLCSFSRHNQNKLEGSKRLPFLPTEIVFHILGFVNICILDSGPKSGIRM